MTDTYDYDAFGNLINSTGSTPNNYLFAGEQYDPALALYYNRARYLNTATGRFWSADTYEGYSRDPLTLHKYLYAGADPVLQTDASGKDFDLGSITVALAVSVTIVALSVPAGGPREGDVLVSPQFLGTTAQNSAQLLAASALAAITNTPLFTKYFGQPASAQRQQLLTTNYQKISNYLQHQITYHKTNVNEFANVIVGTPDQIWLGPLFFNAPWTGVDSKPGTIVHEVSHLAVPTDDIKYGEADAIDLAGSHPDLAVQNADNYEYFAERSATPPAQQLLGP